MKRGALEISFGWLFAIIIGGFILFIAIFLVSKIMNIEQKTQSAKTGEEIGILLNPLETSFESAKLSSLTMPAETRIYCNCSDYGNFGRQIIQVIQKSFGKWQKTGVDVSFQNKYIFSEALEGKGFFIFSKPFEFPFKVADLIYMFPITREYCFTEPPEEIKEELEALNSSNLKLGNCDEKDVKVCFNRGDCEINVDTNNNYVEKENEKMYFYGDALMYATIFSSEETYECQLNRIMKRTETLALIYRDKEESLIEKGCGTELSSELIGLQQMAENFDSSSSISSIALIAETLEIKNNNAQCKLW